MRLSRRSTPAPAVAGAVLSAVAVRFAASGAASGRVALRYRGTPGNRYDNPPREVRP